MLLDAALEAFKVSRLAGNPHDHRLATVGFPAASCADHDLKVVHALPNALLPVITLSGILLGFVLAGSIPVERAFGTPGLGYAMFTAVSERDIFVMQNLVFLYAVVFVVLNILVDLTIAWLDPRIRYQ